MAARNYAVTVSNALIGFIEVKAPGKGADPRRFDDPHDKDQWSKLKSLPNLIYTDGNAFSLWRDGEIVGKIIHLEGDVGTAGVKLEAPATLLPLVTDFLNWSPVPPRTAKKLAEVSARLCRFLREEVIEQMALGNPGLTELAKDWRKLLFRKRTTRNSPTATRRRSHLACWWRVQVTSHCQTGSTTPPRSSGKPAP